MSRVRKRFYHKGDITKKFEEGKQPDGWVLGMSNYLKEKRQAKTKETCLKRYGVENPFQSEWIKEKIKNTNLQKYGVESPTRSPVIKDKTKKTNLEKYGVEYSFQSKEVRDKGKQTLIKRYGVDNISKSDYAKEKKKETTLSHYGVEYSFQSEEIKDRIKKTNLEKYGVEYPLQSDDIKESFRNTCLGRYGVEYPMQSVTIQTKSMKTCLERYGVEHPLQSDEVKEKIKKTNLDKYGVENPMQSDIIQEKSRKTCLEHYGVEYPSQSKEVRKKVRKSCLERYGVENPFQSDEVKEKIRKTCLERYGVEHPLQSEELLEKSRQTCLDHYGVTCSSKSEKVKEKARKTNLERYGVPWTCMREEYTHGTMSSSDSGPNLKFAKLLDNNSVSYEREYPLGDYLYDFKIGKFLVEIDPTYTHNSFMGPFGGTGLSKEYHYSKSITAKENGFFCVHVFDWNHYDDIADKLSIYYHNPKFVWYDSPASSSDSITIGTKSDFMSFHSLGGSDYVVDCIHTIHGLDYLKPYFSEFIKSNSVSSIKLVSDSCKYDVRCVKHLGFKLVEETSIRCNWYSHKSKDLIISDGVPSEMEFDTMVYSGYLPVYDCGQSVYVWKPNIL